MRLISKDGKFDFPYENSMIEKFEGNQWMVKVNGKVFAKYNSEQEMTMEIERMWKAYNNDEKMFKFKV